MREIDLPFDRTKHTAYTKNAKKCVRDLLHRYYDEKTAAMITIKKTALSATALPSARTRNPLAAEYGLRTAESGLLVSVKKETK